MAYTFPWSLLGLQVSGDVADITVYTDRNGRKVAFPKSPPKTPPSPAQVAARERFRIAYVAWSLLSDSDKFQLEEVCRQLGIIMTGQNLYISIALTDDQDARETLIHQSGLALPPITYIP